MDYFCKIEIAGIVKQIRHIRLAEALSVVVMEPRLNRFFDNEVTVTFYGDAYTQWLGKIYDGDFVQILADVDTFGDEDEAPTMSASIYTPDMIIRHETCPVADIKIPTRESVARALQEAVSYIDCDTCPLGAENRCPENSDSCKFDLAQYFIKRAGD